jgi:hypothetical protein
MLKVWVMIKEKIIKKLITPEILASLLRDYPDVVNDFVDMNIEFLIKYYSSKQHVNCRCMVMDNMEVDEE